MADSSNMHHMTTSDHLEPAGDKRKLTAAGKVLLGITGSVFVAVFAVTTPFLLPALRRYCLPYVPATTQQVSNVMRLLEGKRGRIIDLGSGDGRIVIAAAMSGLHGEGIELNPWLVWYSRLNSVRHGVFGNTKFFVRDLWRHSLHSYDHVVVFGVDSMMTELEKKIIKETRPGIQIIACRFPMPTLKLVQTVGDGVDTVWLYKN